jgi:hypothetical protein
LSAVRGCLFNIFPANLAVVSTIRNLKDPHNNIPSTKLPANHLLDHIWFTVCNFCLLCKCVLTRPTAKLWPFCDWDCQRKHHCI